MISTSQNELQATGLQVLQSVFQNRPQEEIDTLTDKIHRLISSHKDHFPKNWQLYMDLRDVLKFAPLNSGRAHLLFKKLVQTKHPLSPKEASVIKPITDHLFEKFQMEAIPPKSLKELCFEKLNVHSSKIQLDLREAYEDRLTKRLKQALDPAHFDCMEALKAYNLGAKYMETKNFEKALLYALYALSVFFDNYPYAEYYYYRSSELLLKASFADPELKKCIKFIHSLFYLTTKKDLSFSFRQDQYLKLLVRQACLKHKDKLLPLTMPLFNHLKEKFQVVDNTYLPLSELDEEQQSLVKKDPENFPPHTYPDLEHLVQCVLSRKHLDEISLNLRLKVLALSGLKILTENKSRSAELLKSARDYLPLTDLPEHEKKKIDLLLYLWSSMLKGKAYEKKHHLKIIELRGSVCLDPYTSSIVDPLIQ